MITLSNLVIFSLFVGLIYGFWHNARFREVALKYTKAYCEKNDIQFLDESLVIRKMWPYRRPDGLLGMSRTYEFEFTSTGEFRHRGLITLKSYHLANMKIPPYPIN